MNEAETRAEYIDPKLQVAGWGVVEGTKILREFRITNGKIQVGNGRSKPEIADYVLVYNNQKVAVIEAKRADLAVGEGVAQAKAYGAKLETPYVYSTNGKEIYEVAMDAGHEQMIERFPTPEELWTRINAKANEWLAKFNSIPFEDVGGTRSPRYYQELAVNKTLQAVANGEDRILLTLATGTGKTFIAFQIAWKLFHARWNLQRDGGRQPRILFLADRNTLANQAYNAFSAFPEEGIARIKPSDIRKKGAVPKSQSVFFSIFQTFMSGSDGSPYFGQYERDFFDFIIIDECHRGGANDEGTWREILEYFSPAVQLGLTATPKRKDNTDTYKYFGEPVYTYSLKAGINDGFLTPFKVRRVITNMNDYVYTPDDQVIEGEIEQGRVYEEEDFNRIITIKEREAYRVKTVLDEINQDEKTIIFCATQEHAAAVRDLVNQYATSTNPHYCVRVTANDGALGDQYLEEFKDDEKNIPTILTTSQKLSTGVDAPQVRNIVLMRPVNSMIEFKQIVGRGTRLFDGKEYFTIYDFVDAYKFFADPEWDGEPIDQTTIDSDKEKVISSDDNGGLDDKTANNDTGEDKKEKRKMIVVKLRDGKEREIQHMISTSFWSADGTPISGEEMLQKLYGDLPTLFKDEDELRSIWANPTTRKAFLQSLDNLGYGKEQLHELQRLIDAEASDIYDVLVYIAEGAPPITRAERVDNNRAAILDTLEKNEKEFINFVLDKYIEVGVDELEEEKLPDLLKIKYHAIVDAQNQLGDIEKIRAIYFNSQKGLYSK